MKIYLKSIPLFFALIVACVTAKAQTSPGAFTEDGTAVKTSEYTDLVGSPYFVADWANGEIKFNDGSVVKDSPVKYDQMKDIVYAKGPNDQLGQFSKPVVEFTIPNEDGTLAHFSTFPGNGKFKDNAFLQVLADGNVKLLKRNEKAISEQKAGLGTAVVTRTVVDNIDYYLLIGGKIVRVKKDKGSFEDALKNHQTELDAYIKTNKLSLKKDDDMAKLITYYNTL